MTIFPSILTGVLTAKFARGKCHLNKVTDVAMETDCQQARWMLGDRSLSMYWMNSSALENIHSFLCLSKSEMSRTENIMLSMNMLLLTYKATVRVFQQMEKIRDTWFDVYLTCLTKYSFWRFFFLAKTKTLTINQGLKGEGEGKGCSKVGERGFLGPRALIVLPWSHFTAWSSGHFCRDP